MGTKFADDISALEQGTLAPHGRLGGRVLVANDAFELAATDVDLDDIIHLMQLPSSARPLECRFASDQLGSASCLADLGVYKIDGTVVDRDCIGSAFNLNSVAFTTDRRYEAANLDTAGKTLWELAGFTEDPLIPLLLSLTIFSVTGAQAGTLAYRILYSM